MKSFCLMNKRTGDLFEGVRVSLFDNFIADADIQSVAWGIHLSQLNHDGWVVFHPDESFAGYWLWFNNKGCDRIFESLGEM